MASLGHGWAVTFGSLGTSFVALTAVTGLSGETLAHDAALVLGMASLISGALVAYVSAGRDGLMRSIPMLLLVGGVMGITQWWVATNGMWVLGATSAALAGAMVGVLYVLSPLHRSETKSLEKAENNDPRSLALALAAYVILLALAFSINLIEPLGGLMDSILIQIEFPAVATSFGWEVPMELGRKISIFGHPGAILFYAAVISFLLYRRVGYYSSEAVWGDIWGQVRQSALKPTISILGLVAMASLMTHSGMTQIIARGISETFSETIYPFFAPFIGTLGAFMTGSNTNSNVVFGALQRETAALLGLSVPIVLAGQTAGASLGSVLAPAKIVVGCSTVGLSGGEGPVIRRMLLLGLIPVWDGRGAGTFGHFGSFSMQSAKTLTAGEGGVLLCRSEEHAWRAASIIDCGRPHDPRGEVYTLGLNYRMSELQAALLNVALERFPRQFHMRQEMADYMDEALTEIEGVRVLKRDPRHHRRSIYKYVFALDPERFGAGNEVVVRALLAEGIPCWQGYNPMYRYDLFQPQLSRLPVPAAFPQYFDFDRMTLPVTEAVSTREGVWLEENIFRAGKQGVDDAVSALKKVQEQLSRNSGLAERIRQA